MGKEQPFIQRVKRALEILAKGNMVIVVDDFDRENEGDLLAVAELATPQTLNFMATHARGLICQPLIKQRAEELGLPLMKENATDTHSTAFTISVDHKSCTTGISAYERAGTVKSLVDPNTKPEDLLQPGHVFPLIAKEGGVFSRKGHTEAAVDLARLAGFSPSGVICEIMNDDGTMARLSELKQFASHHNLHIISVEDIIQYRDAIGDVEIIQHSKSFLPTQYGDFTIYAYSSSDPAIGEMVVLENKKKSTADEDHIMQDSEGVPFVRIHSECVTGEAFASLRCDCGPQLQKAFSIIGEKGGAIVYLKQEGRGIGLFEKIRAYELQDRGADTVEANIALGHEADARRFGAASAVLRQLGYQEIQLLTNNPQKIASVEHSGIKIVKQIPLIEGVGSENLQYLKTKAEKFGHLLQEIGV